jgi:short-subunit dehydrogenase
MTYAIITGASKGIGSSIAEQLAKQGFNLLLVARNGELLRQVAERLSGTYRIQADFQAMDLSLPGAPELLFSYCMGKKYEVSVLVNNAGYGLSGAFADIPLGDSLNMMQVNMAALVQLTHLFLPALKIRSQSYILNIGSSAAYQAVPYMSLYAATKSFVLSFSRGLRSELAGTPVSVTCISPGATDTEFTIRAKIGKKGQEAAAKLNMRPEQVAAIAVRSMLAKRSEVITGGVNKLGAFFVWLLPKPWVEKVAKGIYK